MATREEIAYFRDARAGKASAQLILGKYYLFGGAGLKKNLPTALYWLHRAALREQQEAWMLIGEHITYEVALHAADPLELCAWYERAFDAGVIAAGLTLAKLLLWRTAGELNLPAPRKAIAALEAAAAAGIVEAQWLLAKELIRAGQNGARSGSVAAGGSCAIASVRSPDKGAFEWASRAAANGVLQAQRALADSAWAVGDSAAFLRWSTPVARAIVQRISTKTQSLPLPNADAALLARSADALQASGSGDESEIERFREIAAQSNDKDAQFALGIWYANMDENGERSSRRAGKSNYRKAIHWLTLAGEAGHAKAWYALFKICVRPNTGLAQFTVSETQRFLERAAAAGHPAAQLELGAGLWRSRRSHESNDVRALYWLQKSAAQGNAEAQALLGKIATAPETAPWTHQAQQRMTHELVTTYPFLAARVELAALFGLSLPEALLLDVKSADQGHCLLVDIRAMHARSRRRLVLIDNGAMRTALDRIGQRFADIDCGPAGPEGNYRQRLYLARKLFGSLRSEGHSAFDSAVKEF